MLTQAIGGLLPSAIAVALSPFPIVAVVIVLGTPRARANGPAFALGWVAGLTAVTTVIVLLTSGAGDSTGTARAVDLLKVALGVLLLVLAAKKWKGRPRHGEGPATPGWMATLDSVEPARAMLLGATLSANPKNLALTAAAAASIAEAQLGGRDTAVAATAFVLLGSVTVVGAVAFRLIAGDRSERPLAAVKQFMLHNNDVIVMVILLVFGAKLIGDGLGGLGT